MQKRQKKKQKLYQNNISNLKKIPPFSDGNGRTGRIIIIDNCLKENLIPIIIPKEEKGKYIGFLATENSKEFTKWGLELQKKEMFRMECFKNKELTQIDEALIKK